MGSDEEEELTLLEIVGDDEDISILHQIAIRITIQRLLRKANKVYPVIVFNAEGLSKEEIKERMKADIEYFSEYFYKMRNNVESFNFVIKGLPNEFDTINFIIQNLEEISPQDDKNFVIYSFFNKLIDRVNANELLTLNQD